MSVSEHVDTSTPAKGRVKRKPLGDLTDSAINIANNAVNVDSPSTPRETNRKAYVKKSKAGQFKKGPDNPRTKAKPVEPLSVTRHERQAQRRAQANDPPPTPLPPTPSGLRRSPTPAPLSHPAPTPPASPNRPAKRRKRTKGPRYRRCELCRLARASCRFSDGEPLCCYCGHGGDAGLQWCVKGHHEVSVQDMVGKASCPAHEPPRKSDIRITDEDDDLPWEVFQQRADSKILEEAAVSKADWDLAREFHANLKGIKRQICDICNEERFIARPKPKKGQIRCDRCIKDTKGDNVGTFSVQNLMDPGAVLRSLPELTIAEELLIARVHVLMSYSRVKGVQYKYSGHIINFMQNTPKVVSKLPSLPRELQILHLKPSSANLKNSAVQREYDRRFNVRRDHVEKWLRYLIANHPDYANMTIDADRLSQLPENGSILDDVRSVTLESLEEEASSSQDVEHEENLEDEFPDPQLDAALIEESCVPDSEVTETELRALQDALGCQADNKEEGMDSNAAAPFSMPTMRGTPLSEFDPSLHIECKAFPTLFPRGLAAFTESRQRRVEFDQWVKHLLLYRDGRFARHPQFRYWAFNTLMRSRAAKSAVWMTKQFPGKKLTLEQLKEMASRKDSHLADSIIRRGDVIRGTRPYWKKARSELEAMVLCIGAPSLFFTLSAADMQWSDLYDHAPADIRERYEKATTEPAKAAIATQFLQQNPHIVSEYLTIRWGMFFNDVLKKKFNVKDHWYRYEWQSRGSGHIHGFLWIDGAPTSDMEQDFVDYWGSKVVALNPDATLPRRRFHFPQEHSTEPALGNKLNAKHPMFEPVRNDSLLGKYMPIFTVCWNANTDASPAEKQSQKLADVSRTLLDTIKPDAENPLTSYITKILNKTIVERDWSAQEICHILLGLDLRDSSRAVESLDLRPLHKQRRVVSFDCRGDNDELTVTDTKLEKYCGRKDTKENMTLFQSVRNYRWNARTEDFTSRREVVVNAFPKYKDEKDSDNYCRAKLMLHHPFREIEDLKIVDGVTYETWHDAYQACRDNHVGLHDHDPLGEHRLFQDDDSDMESLASNEKDPIEIEAHEELLALRRPGRDGLWIASTTGFDFEIMCRHKSMSDLVPESSAEAGDPDQLNAKQREVFDLYVNAYLAGCTDQLLTHLDGVAGTGKSRVVDMLSRFLTYHASQKGEECPGSTVLRSAPTGVAAHNIDGFTLHSLFRLPVRREMTSLDKAELAQLQSDLGSCWLLIVDEKSMLGDGGLSAGRLAYSAFQRTIVLEEIMRQRGQSERARLFRRTLDQVRDGPIDNISFDFLASRSRPNLSQEEWSSFRDAIRLYPFRRQVASHNIERLVGLQKPVLRVDATNHGAGAAQVDEDDAGGLPNTLLIAIGARVMLTRNLWTKEGLVNGTMGTVHSILWEDGVQDPHLRLPAMVMVEFDDYEGNGCIDIEGRKVVPIVPITSTFEVNHAICHRTQLPLRLAFAITVHKSQGLTLSKAVVYLQPKGVHTTNAYVALSRVREACDFVIEEPVFRDAFPKLIPARVIERLNDGFRRQGRFDKIIPLPPKKKSDEKKQPTANFEPHGGAPDQPLVVPDGNIDAPPLLNLLTLADAASMLPPERFRLDTPCDAYDRDFFFAHLRQRNEIAEAIGQFPFNRVVNDVGNQGLHTIERSWHGLQFYVDFNALFPFLKAEWLHSSSILAAVSALARPAPNVQLLSPDLSRYVQAVVSRQSENVGPTGILPTTITAVIPVNFSQHWLLVSVTRQNTSLLVTSCNSLPGMGDSSLSRFLEVCVGALQKESNYFGGAVFDGQVRSVTSVRQNDGHSCGVYVIANAIDLLEGRQPSLNRVSPRELRLQYARAAARHHGMGT
ncbi:ATP-dependent DNA helicase [Physcia stellaris]|nr:ATP-dependent DNA helicase [Physcia stellaris]